MEQPVVVVENTSDYTDRQLHYMASFSRTPSPVPGSDSSSENSYSMKGQPTATKMQDGAEKLTGSTVYRSRLNSAKSANAVVVDRPPTSTSPRPPSISGIDQLQQESLFAGLQDTVSNKSFKISADQIFIPLKDETVIRVNDEIFITKPAPSKAENDGPREELRLSGCEKDAKPCPKAEPKKEIISPRAKNTPRPFLPEVVQVICKERIHAEPAVAGEVKTHAAHTKVSSFVDKPYSTLPSLELSSPPIFHPQQQEVMSQPRIANTSMRASVEHDKSPSPKEEAHSTVQAAAEVGHHSLEETVQGYSLSSPTPDVQPSTTSIPQRRKSTVSSPQEERIASSPQLERQTQIERDDTITVENEPCTYMLSSPQFDRQDTVICAKPQTPTPVSERQSFIERQDAIMSPKDVECYQIPSPHEDGDPFPSPIETEASTTGVGFEAQQLYRGDEIESNNSNTASTDKETIIDLKSSDDDIDIPAPDLREHASICDTPDLIEGITRTRSEVSSAGGTLVSEIDNIFKIAEDSGSLDDRDREDVELFEVRSNNVPDTSTDPLSSSETDTRAFANVPPPPEEMDEINGVDPDEWEESDDDSMDSSCVQRIPPPSPSTST